MKYLKQFENFTSLEDFKSIKIGSHVKYSGSSYIVKSNDGIVIDLEDKDNNILSINFNMFKNKGYITK